MSTFYLQLSLMQCCWSRYHTSLCVCRKNKLYVYKTAAELQSVPLGIRPFYGMKVLDY